MPRVNQSYLDARRREILAAAYRCFARDGFQATTMQDVAEEIGLSVGALYRYFDGKHVLVEALAAWGRRQKRDLLRDLTAAAGTAEVADLFVRLAGALPPSAEGDSTVRFDVRIWGEALGQPDLESVVRESLADFQRLIAEHVEDLQREGRMRTDVEAETVAHVMVSLLTGLELQLAFDSSLDRKDYITAVGMLLGGLRPGGH